MTRITWIVLIGLILIGAFAFMRPQPSPEHYIEIRAQTADLEELYSIAQMYQSGEFVAKDEVKAFQYALSAAEQGHALAQHRLAWYYHTGFGCVVDVAVAINWYKKAAVQGIAKSDFNLAGIYWQGEIGGVDIEAAIAHDKLAGQRGHAESNLRLGLFYQEGAENVPADNKRANYYFTQAMKQGNSPAAFHMGNQIWNGRGTKSDLELATALYFIAHRLGQSREAYEYALQFHSPIAEHDILLRANAYIMIELCPELYEIRKDICEVSS